MKHRDLKAYIRRKPKFILNDSGWQFRSQRIFMIILILLFWSPSYSVVPSLKGFPACIALLQNEMWLSQGSFIYLQ